MQPLYRAVLVLIQFKVVIRSKRVNAKWNQLHSQEVEVSVVLLGRRLVPSNAAEHQTTIVRYLGPVFPQQINGPFRHVRKFSRFDMGAKRDPNFFQ